MIFKISKTRPRPNIKSFKDNFGMYGTAVFYTGCYTNFKIAKDNKFAHGLVKENLLMFYLKIKNYCTLFCKYNYVICL